jgi:hypothetical protein
MKSSDPVFKPFSDVRGSRRTRLGITGVRLPLPPAFARLTPELRLARQLKSQQGPEVRFVSSDEGCPPRLPIHTFTRAFVVLRLSQPRQQRAGLRTDC